KVAKVRHMPAMRFADVPGFIADLRKRPGLSARALEFIVLTAARASEAVGATWAEVDLDAAVWTVPADRMKAGRPHRVPLSDAAVALLHDLRPADAKPDQHVFPGARKGNAMTIAAPLRMLQRDMGKPDLTVHGFRSSFRDWAAERTAFDRQTIEASLAHVVRDQTEAAYLRSDVLDKRTRLMQAWTGYLEKPTKPATVTPIRAEAIA
ncbi:MAG: site-specific integrase, partial [Xanthomonadales bacterium]|nr:site-specific integrase [Xanthomonadales bacterium]